MNKRIRKKRLKNCGFFNHRKDLKWKLKHGYRFPWVSEQGPCPIPLCEPGACLICRFCSDIFLDWNGPYGVVCRFGRHEGTCKSFMLDEDQPLFHPEDRKSIDTYIASIRGSYKEPPANMSIEKINSIPEPFEDESILEYIERCFNDTTSSVTTNTIKEIEGGVSNDSDRS